MVVQDLRCFALASSCVIAMLALAGTAGASTLAVDNAGVLRLVAKHGEVNHVTVRDAPPAGASDTWSATRPA